MTQFKCQKCGKNLQGNKRQIWMNYNMHVCTQHPFKEKDLITQCERELGILEGKKNKISR